jgi:hypothetical protein
MWHEYLNSVACTVLLVSMLPVAVLADPRRHPVYVLLMLAAEIALVLQVVSPWLPGLPPVAWPTAILHGICAGCVVMLRKRIWQLVRAELGDAPAPHPMRRAADVMRSASGS